MFETGDEYDNKKNSVRNASAVKLNNQYFTLHKGGRNGYKLHISNRRYLLGTELPNGQVVTFGGWRRFFSNTTHGTNPIAESAWKNLAERSNVRLQGKPLARLTVEKDLEPFKSPADFKPENLPRDTPRGGTVTLEDNEIIVTVDDSDVPKALGDLDAVDLVYDDVEPPTTDQSSSSDRTADRRNHASKSTKTRSIPSHAKENYPELARIFDQGAYTSHKDFRSYLRENNGEDATAKLAGEILSVLEYEIDYISDTYAHPDLMAMKGEDQINVKIFAGETIDKVDLELCADQLTDNDVTKQLVITICTELTDRAEITGWDRGLRVINIEEFQQLVEGAVEKITDTD